MTAGRVVTREDNEGMTIVGMDEVVGMMTIAVVEIVGDEPDGPLID